VFLTLGEGVWFFARRGAQQLPGLFGSRGKGLTVVQGLSGDLPGMVDTHEGGRRAALGLGEHRPGCGGGPGTGVPPGGGSRSVSGSEQGS
jgi:hypothetical protein